MDEAMMKLAHRCEAAAGPDRELDCSIARAQGWVDIVPRPGWTNSAVGKAPADKWSKNRLIPAYTASIDVAMSLADPKALWATGSMEEGPFARLCWPMPNSGYVGGYVEASAATAPLALCAAALRARAHLEPASGKV